MGKSINISPEHFLPVKIRLPLFFSKVFVVVVVAAVIVACALCFWETYWITTKWKVSSLS